MATDPELICEYGGRPAFSLRGFLLLTAGLIILGLLCR